MIALKDNPQVRRWLSFLVGGGLNTGLTYGLYLLLSYLIDYQIAYAIAYAAGIVFAYFFNAKVVFKVEQSLLGMAIYPTIYLVQYIFGALLLNLLVAERSGFQPVDNAEVSGLKDLGERLTREALESLRQTAVTPPAGQRNGAAEPPVS